MDSDALMPDTDRGDAGRGVEADRCATCGSVNDVLCQRPGAQDFSEKPDGSDMPLPENRCDYKPEPGVWYPKAVALAQMSVVEAAIVAEEAFASALTEERVGDAMVGLAYALDRYKAALDQVSA